MGQEGIRPWKAASRDYVLGMAALEFGAAYPVLPQPPF